MDKNIAPEDTKQEPQSHAGRFNDTLVILATIVLLVTGVLAIRVKTLSDRCRHLQKYGLHVEKGIVNASEASLPPCGSDVAAWGYVRFSTPFEESPAVQAGLHELSIKHTDDQKIRLAVRNVDRNGFEYEVFASNVASVAGITVYWVAYDNKTPNNAIGFGDDISDGARSLYKDKLRVHAFQRGFIVQRNDGRSEIISLQKDNLRLGPAGDIAIYCASNSRAMNIGDPLEGEHGIFNEQYRLHIFSKGIIFWKKEGGTIEFVEFPRSFKRLGSY